MSSHSQTLRITSDIHFGRRVPHGALGRFLATFEPLARQAILMAFEGRSTSPGRDPQWFTAASDIRIVDISDDKGDTLLRFEAPELGEAASGLYQQSELFGTRPPPHFTGIDLVGKVIDDVDHSNADSALFDSALLARIGRFRKVFEGGFTEAWVPDGDERQPARLSAETVENARLLHDVTPASRAVRVAGRLDMIWDSRRSFRLQLDDGQEIRGVWKDTVSPLGQLHTQRVLVVGSAVYRPSGKLLRIDAESIVAGEGESRFWSTVPPPMGVAILPKSLRASAGPDEGVNAFFGTWPGDETEEQLLEALEDAV